MKKNSIHLFIICTVCHRYARELCSYSTADDDDILNCETSLVNSLRNLENKMQYDDDTKLYKAIMDPTLPHEKINNSSKLVVKITTDLYGILTSIGQLRQNGILWADELCLYEGLTKYKSCKSELLNDLYSATSEADHLGLKRKKRTTSCKTTKSKNQIKMDGQRKLRNTPPKFDLNKRIPELTNSDVAKIHSNYVGDYQTLRRKSYIRDNQIPNGWQANHIPAKSAFGDGVRDTDIIAHYIPEELHQVSMTYVGTSKRTTVADAIRKQEQSLIATGRLDKAIEIDIVANYGRANVKIKANPLTNKHAQIPMDNNYWPAVVEYRNDLHAVVNGYYKKRKISMDQAMGLHKTIEDINQDFVRYRLLTTDDWFNYIEGRYYNILRETNMELTGKIQKQYRHFG